MNTLVRTLNQQYEKLRDKHAVILEERRRIIYQNIPRIQAIDIEMASFGKEIANAVAENPKQAVQAAEQIASIAQKLKSEKRQLLANHQYGANYLDPIYSCKTCKDVGYLENGRRCECFNKHLTTLAYKHSDLRNKLKAENFNTFNLNIFSDKVNADRSKSVRQNMREIGEKSMAFIAQFNEDNGENMMFFGTTGLGKTFMCSCIAKELIDREKSVVYQTAYSLFNTIQSYKFSDEISDEVKMAYSLLYSSDLLIIDDLGTEFNNSFTQTELFNIINSRLLGGKKIVISTNLNPEDLNNHYGDRIFSRLIGHFTILEFYGEDLRLR